MVSLKVVEAAGLEGLAAFFKTILEEGLVILTRDEADLLTVLLVSYLEPQLAGDVADLRFGQLAQGKEGA